MINHLKMSNFDSVYFLSPKEKKIDYLFCTEVFTPKVGYLCEILSMHIN